MKNAYSFIWAIVLIFTFEPLNAQHVKPYFKLVGRINIDTGTVILLPVGENIYYPGSHGKYTTAIKNGKFTIKDSCLYPYQFRFFIRASTDLVYVSDYFLVDQGTQVVTCNVDSSRKIPAISNKSTIELREKLLKIYSPIDQEIASLNKKQEGLVKKEDNHLANNATAQFSQQISDLTVRKRMALLTYIIDHPNSYVAMWELIRQLKEGYDSSFSTMYNHFSPVIQKSYTGKILKSKIELAGIIAIGAHFPLLQLVDTSNRPVSIQAGETNRSKYTLVDFWFSHCAPCIGQFPQLKEIYQKYKHSGFSITAISTDGAALINDWKSVITTSQLPWEQYLDPDGKNASRLSILRFPTNFLLDDNGVIIKKDVDLPELDNFLKSKLN